MSLWNAENIVYSIVAGFDSGPPEDSSDEVESTATWLDISSGLSVFTGECFE